MANTQGAFSHLPPLTDEEIRMQMERAIRKGWAPVIELTDDPSPRNHYWQMWSLPAFDETDPAHVVAEINRCRTAFPDHFVKVSALDCSLGRQSIAISFIVQRPVEHA